MKLSKHRINVRTIRNLSENGGLTLRDGYAVTYKSGYQVATESEVTTTPDMAMIMARCKKNCGIWYANGLYYVDASRRISTKGEALKLAREHEQVSILKWATMELIYC